MRADWAERPALPPEEGPCRRLKRNARGLFRIANFGRPVFAGAQHDTSLDFQLIFEA
jgi:hypothetical protein